MLLGAVLSATDPVAVIALLKELGASKEFSILIEGEAILNDGTGIVLYAIILKIITGASANVGDVIVSFIRLALGGSLLGLAFAIATTWWLSKHFNKLM